MSRTASRGNNLAVMAWRNLWRNRRRSLLTLSSIVFGVFLAVIMTAMQDRNWAEMIDLSARLGGGHVTLQEPRGLSRSLTTRTTLAHDEALILGGASLAGRSPGRALFALVEAEPLEVD